MGLALKRTASVGLYLGGSSGLVSMELFVQATVVAASINSSDPAILH